jgi:hypothetical protein
MPMLYTDREAVIFAVHIVMAIQIFHMNVQEYYGRPQKYAKNVNSFILLTCSLAVK